MTFLLTPDLFEIHGLVAIQALGGLALYFSLSALSYWYFFVRKRETYFPGEAFDRPEMGKAMQTAVWGTLGNAVLASPIQYMIHHGHTKVYYDVAAFGWGYLLLSAVLILVVTETLIYWIHRALHTPLLFRHLHRHHHAFRLPTPWVSMAFHPLDSFWQSLPHYLCLFLFPVHIGVFWAYLVYVMLWSFFIHDRVSWARLGVVNYTACHTLHHLYNRFNYGQFLTVWDRFMGTYKDPRHETRFDVLRPAPAPAARPALAE